MVFKCDMCKEGEHSICDRADAEYHDEFTTCDDVDPSGRDCRCKCMRLDTDGCWEPSPLGVWELES